MIYIDMHANDLTNVPEYMVSRSHERDQTLVQHSI